MLKPLFLNLPITIAMVVLLIGLWMMLRRRNLIRILMGLSLVEAGVNLFLVALGYRHDALAPIYTGQPDPPPLMVLPTVQALTLTAIVIGLATTAMLLSFAMAHHRKTGSLDVEDMRRLRE